MVTAPVLQRLTALASDPSSDGRYRFLNALTDLFFTQPAPSRQASTYFSEIAAFSLDHMHDPLRVRYTERVAADDKLPHELALRLAADPCADVAGPVLARSPVLSAADVKRLAAGRQDLPEAVIALVSKYAGADELDELFPAKNAGPKRPKKQAPGTFPDGAPVALPPAFRPAAKQPRRQPPASGLKALIAEIAAGERPVDEVVAGLASQDKAFELARVLGALGEIPDSLVLKNLLDADVEPIMGACRSAGIGPDGFKAVLGLRAARLNLPARDVARHLEAYSAAEIVKEPGEA
jgi:hypothetical protein